MGRTLGLLGKSIISTDFYILIATIAAFVCFMVPVTVYRGMGIGDEYASPGISDNCLIRGSRRTSFFDHLTVLEKSDNEFYLS